MSFLTGIGTIIQIGKESSFKEDVLPTTLVNHTSEGINVTVSKSDEGSLLASKTANSKDLLAITIDGSISFVLRPEFAGLLFQLAFGGTDTISPITESDNFTHTINLCEANSDLPTFQITIDKKAAIKKYIGCTISSLSITCAASDYVKGSFDIKGSEEKQGTINQEIKSFKIPSYRCTSAKFTVADTIFDISTATFKLDNALEEAPKTYASGVYQTKPQHGRRNVTIDFEIPYSSEIENFKTNYLLTEKMAKIELLFTSSDPDYYIKLTLNNVSINNVSANVGGTGILTSSISGEALSIDNIEPVTVSITDKTNTPYGE